MKFIVGLPEGTSPMAQSKIMYVIFLHLKGATWIYFKMKAFLALHQLRPNWAMYQNFSCCGESRITHLGEYLNSFMISMLTTAKST